MTDRQRAIAVVAGLVTKYRSGATHAPAFVRRWYGLRAEALGKEIGIMQASGDDGERLARTWCKLAAP